MADDELRERVARALRPRVAELCESWLAGFTDPAQGEWLDHQTGELADAVLAALDLPARDAAERRKTAEAIHDRIIAELVCCEVYDQHAEAGTYDETIHGHAICYWGEAGARIALDHADLGSPTEAQRLSTTVGGPHTHRYLSTSCLHGRCRHCRSATAIDGGTKQPGTCKWCPAACVCECHSEAAEAAG